MGVPIQEFLANRRNRAVGTILGNAERGIFKKLSEEEQESFRTTVRDAIASYHDSVLDLVRAEDGIRNDEVVSALNKLETAVRSGRSLPAAITKAPAGSNGRQI